LHDHAPKARDFENGFLAQVFFYQEDTGSQGAMAWVMPSLSADARNDRIS
jgi:hypothetical protein